MMDNKELAVPEDQYFCANTIEGVTDNVQGGERWG